MLPSARNAETISILKRLRQRGSPKPGLADNLGTLAGEADVEDGDTDEEGNGSIARASSTKLLDPDLGSEYEEEPTDVGPSAASRLQDKIRRKKLRGRSVAGGES